MELIQAIHTRKSIRSFQKQKISKENLERILTSGMLAPSGKNGQPWKFWLIQENKEKLQSIADLTLYKDFVRKSDCLILVFLDKLHSYHYVKDVQAIGACMENMLLTITDIGLGGCWIGEILNRDLFVKKILQLDNRYELMGLIAVGYPEQSNKAPIKKKLSSCLMQWE